MNVDNLDLNTLILAGVALAVSAAALGVGTAAAYVVRVIRKWDRLDR